MRVLMTMDVLHSPYSIVQQSDGIVQLISLSKRVNEVVHRRDRMRLILSSTSFHLRSIIHMTKIF